MDIKKINYISQALERRKKFFNGCKGSDPYKFMSDLKKSIRFMGLSQDEVFCCLPVTLQEEAFEWFRLEEASFSDFQSFERAFLEHYRVLYFQDRVAKEARLRTQGTEESIQTYLTCLRLIFDKMDPSLPLDRQLDKAVKNLTPTYLLQINRKDVRSYENLLSLGKQLEVKTLNIKQYKDPPPLPPWPFFQIRLIILRLRRNLKNTIKNSHQEEK